MRRLSPSRIVFTALLLAGLAGIAAAQDGPTAPGDSVGQEESPRSGAGGLRVELRLESTPGGGAAFGVTIRNDGTEDRLLLLGSLATHIHGVKPLYDNVRIGLRDADGEGYRLYFAPLWRDCNCSPLLVPLPPGARYGLRFPVADLVWVMRRERGGKGLEWLAPGTYMATATIDSRSWVPESARGGRSFTWSAAAEAVWEGSFVSNEVAVPLADLLR